MGQHLQPKRVPAAARRRRGGRPGLRLHIHAAQPQLPPPPPLLRRRRRARPLRRGRRRHPPPRGPRAAPFFSSSYGLDAVPAPPLIDAGPAHNALEREMCLGPAAGPTWAGPVGGTDRRKKRMIKNRESAARSRARKQAYIRELEKEVKHLQQENQSLRDKYEQVRVSAEVQVPLPIKKLQRMHSAPY